MTPKSSGNSRLLGRGPAPSTPAARRDGSTQPSRKPQPMMTVDLQQVTVQQFVEFDPITTASMTQRANQSGSKITEFLKIDFLIIAQNDTVERRAKNGKKTPHLESCQLINREWIAFVPLVRTLCQSPEWWFITLTCVGFNCMSNEVRCNIHERSRVIDLSPHQFVCFFSLCSQFCEHRVVCSVAVLCSFALWLFAL